jgi:hypothetical protein
MPPPDFFPSPRGGPQAVSCRSARALVPPAAVCHDGRVRRAWILGLLAALPLGEPVAGAQSKPPKSKPTAAAPSADAGAREAEDRRAREAYATLSDGERKDLVDYFTLEAQGLDTLQGALTAFVLRSEARDRGEWPEEAPLPFFDPQEHAPAQPIARRRLAPDDPAARALVERVRARVPEPPFRSVWRYDYATRELRRTAPPDRARDFENALAGFVPDLDLAVALVERTLDDGSRQKEHAVFGHAYTDREGRVFPLTLEEARSSGAEIEMPDVDALGVIHSLLRDHKNWVAPVEASQQSALYKRIEELHRPARQHLALRRAIARCFVVGTQDLPDLYGPTLDNFHALWELHKSTPEKVAAELEGKDPAKFVADFVKRCFKDGKMFQKGVARHAELDRNRALLRATLLRALEEFGGYERLNKKSEGR